jgi:hypothetical protein
MTDLIVSAAAPMVQYIADGSGRSYGFPFPLLAAEDLAVWLDDAPSAIAFTVSGLNSSGGGSILFATPPAAGLRITLARRMAIKRETDFVEGGEFRARALNEELDRLTLLVGPTVFDECFSICNTSRNEKDRLSSPPPVNCSVTNFILNVAWDFPRDSAIVLPIHTS